MKGGANGRERLGVWVSACSPGKVEGGVYDWFVMAC